MFRICNTILSFCLVLICTSPVLAQLNTEDCSSNAYLIPSVMIDTEGTTGTQARKNGIEKATQSAFEQLIDRMILPGQDNGLIDRQAVDRFVDFIRISSENALPRRYIATVDICFDATRVRAAFVDAEISWSELTSPPVLLLPVWEEPAGVRVWARNISWLEGWQLFEADKNSLVQFTMLQPNLEIERQLSALEIASQNPDTIKRAIAEAGALQAAWIYAGLDYSSSVPELVLEAVLFDNTGRPLAELFSERQKLDGLFNMQAGFADFREQIISEITQRWKAGNTYQLAEQNEIIITVDVNDFQGWQNIRRVLYAQDIVNELMPISLNATTAVMKAQLSAPVESLQLSIKTSGFALEAAENGYIMRVDAAQ